MDVYALIRQLLSALLKLQGTIHFRLNFNNGNTWVPFVGTLLDGL